MTTSMTNIEQLAINTIRTLAMDGVEAANSGHPGTPMALAPVTYLLYEEVLRYDPAAPDWPGRDRFILSCGHASMLLYAMLHLAGVRQTGTDEPAVSLDDLRRFRQLGSRSPGHPEHGLTSGVETSTGPLGQGIANGVGMAIASRWLAKHYNRPGYDLFNFDVYCLCSDGDLMEGIGGEAASLAGHLKLSNLCWIYDDNGITIEGKTELSFSEDVAARFTGYGWNVVEVENVNNLDALRGAIGFFQEANDRPTLVIVKSQIAFGAPNKAGTAAAHGAPLGADEVQGAKQAYGWPVAEPFHVPDAVREHFAAGIGARGANLREQWNAKYAEYKEKYPVLAKQVETLLAGDLPEGWDAAMANFDPDPKGMATRVSSGKVLNQVAQNIPWMLGGSADLAPSNKSDLTFDAAGDFQAGTPGGRNFHFGVREHVMAATTNGMVLCGLRAYAATFFVFVDYLRPALRMAAIMELPVLYIFTHDSIGVGEDGPTHQPVEQLASLRAIPNVVVLRPADANEVAEAYRTALTLKKRPVALALTRQNLPTLDRTKYAPASGVARGAYVLADPPGDVQVILIGSGSEISLCLTAQQRLDAEGVAARVVSMPSWELFDEQPPEYRDWVLPPSISARVAVEAGVELGWSKYAGASGRFVGMNGFGASGPYQQLYQHFGITVDAIVAAAKETLGR
ncbi:MAG: transketolase [Pirellulales bacterium]|nr:transketolase [Pirellulales bacterium]